MSFRSLHELEKETHARAGEWLRLASSRGVAVLVYETYRPPKRQEMLYERGRTAPGPIVTNARPWHSAHQFRRALDAVPWGWYVNDAEIGRGPIGQFSDASVMQKKLDWTPFPSHAAEDRFRDDGSLEHLDPDWRVMVEAAETAGLEWAGRWTSFREYVHFQHLGGATIAQWRTELTDDQRRA